MNFLKTFNSRLIGGGLATAWVTERLLKQKQALADQGGLQAYMVSASTLNPKYDKREKKGEDSLYIAPNERLVCVMDGVGGWIEILVDAGLMTKELTGHIKDTYENRYLTGELSTLNQVLDESVKLTKAKGSTTCVLFEVQEEAKDEENIHVKTSNLGDSGYLVLRPTATSLETVFKSESQQHYFNCPYQIGNHSKLPSKATPNEHTLHANDIIVLGTDGVWDNAFNDDVKNCVSPQLDRATLSVKNLQAVSDCISTYAECVSYDKDYVSPFTIESRQHKKDKVGGKEDDITVIVSQIKTREML